MCKASSTSVVSRLRCKADITYVRLQVEFVFLAVLLDAFSRSCVGWAHPKLIDARQHHILGKIGVNRQLVLGVGGENKFPLPQTQQVIHPHEPQNSLVVYLPSPAKQFALDATIAVSRPLQRDFLHLAAQIHVAFFAFRSPQER